MNVADRTSVGSLGRRTSLMTGTSGPVDARSNPSASASAATQRRTNGQATLQPVFDADSLVTALLHSDGQRGGPPSAPLRNELVARVVDRHRDALAVVLVGAS